MLLWINYMICIYFFLVDLKHGLVIPSFVFAAMFTASGVYQNLFQPCIPFPCWFEALFVTLNCFLFIVFAAIFTASATYQNLPHPLISFPCWLEALFVTLDSFLFTVFAIVLSLSSLAWNKLDNASNGWAKLARLIMKGLEPTNVQYRPPPLILEVSLKCVSWGVEFHIIEIFNNLVEHDAWSLFNFWAFRVIPHISFRVSPLWFWALQSWCCYCTFKDSRLFDKQKLHTQREHYRVPMFSANS